jgi:hypothetical protein
MIERHINNLKIKILKRKLNKEVKRDNLLSSKVYKISIELDKCIVNYYKYNLGK